MLLRLVYRVGVVGIVVLLLMWRSTYLAVPAVLIAGIVRCWWLLQWGPLALDRQHA